MVNRETLIPKYDRRKIDWNFEMQFYGVVNAVMRLIVGSIWMISDCIRYGLVHVERQTYDDLDADGCKQISMNSRPVILQTPENSK